MNTPRRTDPWYDMHKPLSDRLLEVYADGSGNPEALLMAAEEREGISVLEKARGAQRRAMVRESRASHPQRRILKRLAPKDRETLLLTHGHGMSAPAIAKVAGVSKQAIHKRQASAQKRADWLAGPGRLFNGRDLRHDLQWRVADQDIRMLWLLWTHKSIQHVASLMPMNHKLVRTRWLALLRVKLPLLTQEDPERYGKYLEGFSALRIAMSHKSTGR